MNRNYIRQKVDKLVPARIKEALIASPPDLFKWTILEKGRGHIEAQGPCHPLIREFINTGRNGHPMTGGDVLAFAAHQSFFQKGPKVFVPSPAQCEALKNVELRLKVEDYAQPYPTLFIIFDWDDPYFESCLVHWCPSGIVAVLQSRDPWKEVGPNEWVAKDVVTSLTSGSEADLEVGINTWEGPEYENVSPEDHASSVLALRIALNSCLALTHYGTHSNYLFPKEVDRDRKLSKEVSNRGFDARQRVKQAVQVTTFSQEVRLHRVSEGRKSTHDPDQDPNAEKREVSPHWRKGYWRMQACGEKWSERKRIFIPPVLVRADLFVGDLANTEVVVKGDNPR